MLLDPSDIDAYPVENGMSVWFLGGPSLAIRTVGSMLYLDLFTGPSPVPSVTKAIPEAIDPAAIRRADIAISTHFDEDHCDRNSLTWLHKNTQSLFLGPVSCNRLYQEWGFSLDRMRQIAAYESFGTNDVIVHAYPACDVFDPDAVTYVIESSDVCIFDAGDSLYLPEMRQIGQEWNLDVALLSYANNPPGKTYYMDADGIVNAARDLRAKTIVLKHYDLWREFLADPFPLIERLRESGHDARVFQLKERFDIRGEG